MIMDLINQHSWETGISKQEFIRLAVRSMLSSKYDKDIELVIIDTLRNKNEKYTNQDPKLV
jgi:20S proteasome alpha/beta subunit